MALITQKADEVLPTQSKRRHQDTSNTFQEKKTFIRAALGQCCENDDLLLVAAACGMWLRTGHNRLHANMYIKMLLVPLGQCSSDPLTNWVVGGTRQTIQQRFSSSVFCRRPLWALLAWAWMSTLWCCPSSISSADHSSRKVTHKSWFTSLFFPLLFSPLHFTQAARAAQPKVLSVYAVSKCLPTVT